MWLIFGTVAYLKETGDFSILDEKVPFDNKKGTEVTLMEHLKVSFDHVVKNRGPHKLPLIGRADWNDCLNLNCFSHDPNESFQTTENKTKGSKAESLMIAGLFCVCGNDYADLCRFLGKPGEAARASKAVAEMEKAVEKYGWDGAWYLRAYDFFGKKVGSKSNDEGKIFIESQGWCAMAEIGKKKRMPEKALDATKKYLECEHGIVLNQPAFTKYVVEYGEISTYPAGYKENAGIFCHNNPWIIIAEAIAGRGNDAFAHWAKIAPSYTEEKSALHKVEPYVYSQMVAGRDAAKPGEAKNSWLTGTAAWNWYAVSQYILGIRPDYDGLVVDPCLPKTMKGFTVVRKFRGAEYAITVRNPAGVEKGVVRVLFDGRPLPGAKLPVVSGRHEVVVTMGKH